MSRQPLQARLEPLLPADEPRTAVILTTAYVIDEAMAAQDLSTISGVVGALKVLASMLPKPAAVEVEPVEPVDDLEERLAAIANG